MGDPLGGEFNTLAPFDETGKYAEQIREKNKKGYWELDNDYVINTLLKKPFGKNGYGKAIKALGATLPLFSPKDIDLAILCLRKDRNKQAQSMYELMQAELGIVDTSKKDLGWIGEKVNIFKDWSLEDVRRNQDHSLNMITKKLSYEKILTHITFFEDMKKDPAKEVKRLVEALKLSERSFNTKEEETYARKYSKKKIKKAIENID